MHNAPVDRKTTELNRKTDKWLRSPSHLKKNHFLPFNCHFVSLIKGITLKICLLCFVPINILLNLVCVWYEQLVSDLDFTGL